MNSPYSLPTTSLHYDVVSKKRVIHCFAAAGSSFVFLPVIVLIITCMITKSLDIVNINIRFLTLDIAGALLAGLTVYPFRSLAWYWAALVGPVVGFICMIALGIVIDAFTD